MTRGRALLVGGVAVGVFDLLDAFIFFGRRGITPVQILHSIASGLLGRAAWKGGAPTAILGAVLHFFIATTATAVYYAASRKFKVLVDQPIVCGLAYGIPVYLVMNHVVLPLSAVPFKPPQMLGAIFTALLILMFCVGLPIALVVRRYLRNR